MFLRVSGGPLSSATAPRALCSSSEEALPGVAASRASPAAPGALPWRVEAPLALRRVAGGVAGEEVPGAQRASGAHRGQEDGGSSGGEGAGEGAGHGAAAGSLSSGGAKQEGEPRAGEDFAQPGGRRKTPMRASRGGERGDYAALAPARTAQPSPAQPGGLARIAARGCVHPERASAPTPAWTALGGAGDPQSGGPPPRAPCERGRQATSDCRYLPPGPQLPQPRLLPGCPEAAAAGLPPPGLSGTSVNTGPQSQPGPQPRGCVLGPALLLFQRGGGIGIWLSWRISPWARLAGTCWAPSHQHRDSTRRRIKQPKGPAAQRSPVHFRNYFDTEMIWFVHQDI